MKRKRTSGRRKPKRPLEEQAVQNDAALIADYGLEDIGSEYAAMDDQTEQAETNRSCPTMGKSQADDRTVDNVNSLHKTKFSVLGGLSKLAESIAANQSRGNDSYVKFDSRVETETPRTDTNMSDQQADLAIEEVVNGKMENYPNSLRELIVAIIKDMSKEAGGLTNLSRSLVDDPISNELTLQPHVGRALEEKASSLNQDPAYREEELQSALKVIRKTMKLDAAEPFNTPVNPIELGIPDYFDVIKTPMDFGTICNNLENGLKYMNSADVYRDVQFIWDNCLTYNKKGGLILELMKRVKTNFMKYWKAAGLHKEQPQAIDESTMTGNKRRPSHSVGPTFNQKQPSVEQADVGASTTGNLHLQLPRECATAHSMPKDKISANPIIPTTGKISQSHGRLNCSSQNKNTPQLSSNKEHCSLKRTDANAAVAESSPLSFSKRGNNRPVVSLAENNIHLLQNEATSYQFHENLPSPSNMNAGQPQQGSSNPQSSMQQGEENIVASASNQKKRVRGRTRCLKVLTANGRISITTNEFGQPIGPEASQLTSFLGVTARNGNWAPLTYRSWSKMPEENKENMWQKVLTKFDIDPSSRSWVLMSLGKKWRNFKSLLKTTHYDTHATDEERLADRDERVLPDQWSVLVSQWSSESWQNMSAQNKMNRAQQKFSHTAGKKSFARVREEERAKRPDGKEPSQAELFILTRTRKNGEPVNEATAAVISQLRESAARQEDTEVDGSKPLDDAFSRIMGPDRKGGVSLYGLGPTPSRLGNGLPTRIEAMKMVSEKNAEVLEMKEKLESVEKTCSQMAAQMAAMVSMMTSMQKSSPGKDTSNVVAGNLVPVDIPYQSEPTTTSHYEVPFQQTRGRKKKS